MVSESEPVVREPPPPRPGSAADPEGGRQRDRQRGAEGRQRGAEGQTEGAEGSRDTDREEQRDRQGGAEG